MFGQILGDFFTNSSGHPESSQRKIRMTETEFLFRFRGNKQGQYWGHTQYVHFSGNEMDSKMLTFTAPANSLEAFLILVV
jgi:hypothetical protein